MTASKSLPTRPSLESLRKQAKKLARDVRPPLAEQSRAHRTSLREPPPSFDQLDLNLLTLNTS
jgi:hypothetical protein